jgi:hypothetical protein
MLSKALVFLALTGISLAAPANLMARDLSWTLQSFTRTCGDSSCTYTYSINENDNNPAIPCTYTIPGNNKTTFEQIPCTNSTRFSLNQGYEPNGDFITLVVTDTVKNLWSFMGYSHYDFITNGVAVTPDITRQATTVGQFSKRQTSSPGWTVGSFSRYCLGTNVCTVSFSINENNGSNSTQCQVSADGGEKASFYGRPCATTSPYQISWGYNEQYDSAVMTVLSTTEKRNAWFGFDAVNSEDPHVYGDVGPNPVYDVGSP